MLSKKKKIIILCSMIALLILTGVLNVILNNQALGKGGDSLTGGEVTYGNFFASYRTDRQETRKDSMTFLDEIIVSPSSSKEAVEQAQTKKFAMVEMMEKELVLEGLVKALGYKDCIITMSTDNINCILKTEKLDSVQVTQILNILVRETGRPATGIKIMPIQ